MIIISMKPFIIRDIRLLVTYTKEDIIKDNEKIFYTYKLKQ